MHEIFVGIRVVGDPHDPVVSRKLRIFIRGGQRLGVLVAVSAPHGCDDLRSGRRALRVFDDRCEDDTVADPALKRTFRVRLNVGLDVIQIVLCDARGVPVSDDNGGLCWRGEKPRQIGRVRGGRARDAGYFGNRIGGTAARVAVNFFDVYASEWLGRGQSEKSQREHRRGRTKEGGGGSSYYTKRS